MPWFRAYVDKKITDKGGGEHSRQIDAEAKDKQTFEESLKLKKDEELNQIVELAWDPNL